MEKNKKELTHDQILSAAGRGFRKNGYAGIGVDGLAQMAGVTSGAFYAHMGSKKKAFEAALVQGLDEVIETIPRLQANDGESWLKNFAEYYLSVGHQKNLECGCAMATLTSEVIKFDSGIHKVYEKKMSTIVSLVAQGLKGKSQEKNEKAAWAFLSIIIGGLSIVRALNNKSSRELVAKQIIESALFVVNH